jgi:hypothetical protein
MSSINHVFPDSHGARHPPQPSSNRPQSNTSTEQNPSPNYEQDSGHTGDRQGRLSQVPNADAVEGSSSRSAQEDGEPSWLNMLADRLHNLQREINDEIENVRIMRVELSDATARGNACLYLKTPHGAHAQPPRTTESSYAGAVQSSIPERLDEIQGKLRVTAFSASAQLDSIRKDVEGNETTIDKIFVILNDLTLSITSDVREGLDAELPRLTDTIRKDLRTSMTDADARNEENLQLSELGRSAD